MDAAVSSDEFSDYSVLSVFRSEGFDHALIRLGNVQGAVWSEFDEPSLAKILGDQLDLKSRADPEGGSPGTDV
jgi:hypothetical protein